MLRRGAGPPGPPLPYELIAAVVPTPAGWLVAGAKVQGANLAPEPPFVESTLVSVLDARPPFQVTALNAPVGLVAESEPGGRDCDRAARLLLGDAVAPAPSLEALARPSAELDRVREIAAEMAPYRQRVVYETRGELSFFQLNGEQVLAHGRETEAGQAERRALLSTRIAGVERVLDAELDGVGVVHLQEAAATLWTARRILVRAAIRLPEFPVWSEDGLRMEIVR